MELTLKKTQEIELNILRFLKEVCDKNDLKYYLAFGTLIGATRHNGFIPWDDDIDVWMPKQDIKKLIEIMDKMAHPYYKVVSMYNYPEFTAPLPKIIDSRTKLVQNYGFIERVELGIYIDIFPLDGAGNTLDEAEKLYNEAHSLYKHWNHADTKMFVPDHNKFISLLRWVKHIPDKLYGIHNWLEKLDYYTDMHSYDKCDYVGVLTNMEDTPVGNVFHKNILGSDTFLPFEHEYFRVPEKYDELLTIQYGDYMKLPPEEKQVSHHKYEVEWIGERND